MRPPRAKGIVPPTSGIATPFRVVLPATYVVPEGMASVSVTPLAAAVPVFWIATAYLSGPPGTAGVGDAVFAASMRATSVVTVFVVKVPFCVGCPAQLTYWYVQLAVESYCAAAGLAGIAMHLHLELHRPRPAAGDGAEVHARARVGAGLDDAVHLEAPRTNVVPGGGGSVNTTLVASTMPVFDTRRRVRERVARRRSSSCRPTWR